MWAERDIEAFTVQDCLKVHSKWMQVLLSGKPNITGIIK